MEDSELLGVGRSRGFLVLAGLQLWPWIFPFVVSWLGSAKTMENGVLSSRWVNGFFGFVWAVRGWSEMVDKAGLYHGPQQ